MAQASWAVGPWSVWAVGEDPGSSEGCGLQLAGSVAGKLRGQLAGLTVPRCTDPVCVLLISVVPSELGKGVGKPSPENSAQGTS